MERMRTKAETNQALMNEIALLSRLLRNSRHPGSGQQHHHHNFHSNGSYKKTIPLPHEKPTINARAFPNIHSYAAPGLVSAASILSNPEIQNHEKNKRDLNNRYKIDRRVENNVDQPPSSIRKPASPVVLPKTPSPKKYEIVKKYFLRRTKSPVTSALGAYQPSSPAKLPVGQGEEKRRINVPVADNSQRIANRVLQRSIHRLRSRNPVCSWFKRFGKCNRQGVCPYLHVQHISQIGMRKAMRKFRAGLKPPCVFHARGRCVTLNCPFPHITPEEEKAEREKRKLNEAERKKALKPKRYYEQESPAPAEYISLIVPRNNIRAGASSGGNSLAQQTVSTSHPPPELDPRRERLMSKMALLKLRYGQSNNTRPGREVPAPEFLPFKK